MINFVAALCSVLSISFILIIGDVARVGYLAWTKRFGLLSFVKTVSRKYLFIRNYCESAMLNTLNNPSRNNIYLCSLYLFS